MARMFFTDRISGDVAYITGQDAHHIHTVLRRTKGDSISICDGDGMEYGCVITASDDEEICLQILTKGASRSESSLQITLYQAMPKGDKMDLIVEKAVELGAAKVVPFLSEFCISRPDPKSAAKKADRWQKRMETAAKQSGRGMVPQCGQMISFAQMVQELQQYDKALFFYERATDSLAQAMGDMTEGTVAIIVGCEGGFSPKEAQAILDAGVPAITLGPRILRCETAPIVALSLLQYISGNLD